MLFSMLCFVSLPPGQVWPKNNLCETISACLGQALILNPAPRKKRQWLLLRYQVKLDFICEIMLHIINFMAGDAVTLQTFICYNNIMVSTLL